jgi:hypothetical protein
MEHSSTTVNRSQGRERDVEISDQMERKLQKQKFLAYYFQKWDKFSVGYKIRTRTQRKSLQFFFDEWYLINISSEHFRVSLEV